MTDFDYRDFEMVGEICQKPVHLPMTSTKWSAFSGACRFRELLAAVLRRATSRAGRRLVWILFASAIFLQTSAVQGNASTCPQPTLDQSAWASRRSLDKVRLAVLPLGAIEQHGPHLPFGTDAFLATAFAKSLAEHYPISLSVLPTSPFGASFEHASFRGTLAVDDASLQGVWSSVLGGISAAGVNACILLNAHGGQTPNAQIVARQARFDITPPFLAVVVNLQALIHDSADVAGGGKDWEWEARHGIHGGLVETALMLHLHPELVDMEQARRFGPRTSARLGHLEPYGATVSYGWRAEDVFADGAGGDAGRATPELGRKIFEKATLALVEIAGDVLDIDVDSMFTRE